MVGYFKKGGGGEPGPAQHLQWFRRSLVKSNFGRIEILGKRKEGEQPFHSVGRSLIDGCDERSSQGEEKRKGVVTIK